ncbi:hypothetical protein BCR39DRAFT_137457 [Naematelia encephala]|uniref:Uncharacterized protein n=1 Tax=Naematelia encephala TaxID=71784 RepID=A0A1Y2BJG8_9TREE|nr:hypothetical protein BCR39DRAFT_137457 [Naematelia encephala]
MMNYIIILLTKKSMQNLYINYPTRSPVPFEYPSDRINPDTTSFKSPSSINGNTISPSLTPSTSRYLSPNQARGIEV